MKTITFDIDRVKGLKDSYESAIKFCEEDFPSVNLDSSVQVKSFLRENFNLDLPDMKIKTINMLWEGCIPETMLQDALYSLLTYLKTRATLRNYINCILKHQKEGIVTLRLVDERLLMPNKQPISYNEEIIDCIVDACDEVLSQIELYRKSSHKRCSVAC